MNGTVIFELLGEVETNVVLLEELRPLTRAEFVKEPRNYLYAERCFQIAIQCLVDISYYLASQKQWPKRILPATQCNLWGDRVLDAGTLRQDRWNG